MIFSCELTTTGCLVTWSGPVAAGESIVFYTGRTAETMSAKFTSLVSPGSEVLTVGDDSDVLLPNLSGLLDVVDSNGSVLRSSGVRPLVPGLSAKDVRLLYKLADDHTKSCILRGTTARLYRRRSTGTPCTTCCDPVNGLQLVEDCSVCGGSGIQAGWLGPFLTSVLFMQHAQEDTAPAGGGAAQETVIEVVRLKAFPRPRAGDRLLIPMARKLYILGHPQKTVAGVAGIPAVIEVQARLPDPDTSEAVIPEDW